MKRKTQIKIKVIKNWIQKMEKSLRRRNKQRKEVH
jgi:hypothetical protein